MKKHRNLHDSKRRQVWPSGAMTEPKVMKGRFDLIPAEPLFRLALIYELGAKKYKPNNWKLGVPWSNCLNSLERHLQKWKRGDNNEDHLAMVLWRVMALMYYEEKHKELCDIEERKRTLL